MVAITIGFLTIYDKKMMDRMNRLEVIFTELHEQHHRKHWWRIGSHQDEIEATADAWRQLVDQGYSIEELLNAELNLRLLDKYGKRLEDFLEVMPK